MKKFTLLTALVLSSLLSGAELVYKNAFFQVRFDTKGAVIKELIHKKENWNGSSKAGSSFGEMRIGRATGPKSQEHENFEKYDFAIKEWKVKGTNTVDITFTACGTVFKDIRLYKTYKFDHYRSNEMVVEYVLENTSQKPQSIFLSTRTFFRRSGKNNTFYQPRAKGDAALVNSKYLEFSLLPPRRYLAVAGDDKSGLVMEFPADSVTGFMNWFLKEGYPTQEYYSDERVLAPGEKRKITVKVTFAKDVHAYKSRAAMKTVKIKGKVPPQVEQLNREEDPSYRVRTVKAPTPVDRNFVDITLNRQFNDSWRAVMLPANAVIKNIAVYELENGTHSVDRPVGYTLKGKVLNLFIPGLLPGHTTWRSQVINGFLQQKFGGMCAAGPIAFKCRIFFDRPGGKILKETAPEGGELWINGSFEKADPKNAKIPQYAQFVSNHNRKTLWRKEGGFKNSRCLEGGSAVFAFFPEKGTTYELNVQLKHVGGNGRSWLYLTFYDAQGKMMSKARKLLFCSDNAFDWKQVKKSFIAPKDAAMAELTVSRGKTDGRLILIDDFSVKTAPVSSVKISAKEMARRELLTQWDIPVNELESISLAAAMPLKKWFVPAEKKVDVLVLACENRVGRLHGTKREIAELASRLPMDLKCIPVIRETISSTGSYGVWVMTFKKTLSAYTAECLKEIKAPKVVVMTTFQRQLHDKDLMDILVKWQKAGTHFLFYSCTVPKELKGKYILSPIKPVVPAMRNLPPEKMITWYKKGNSYVASSGHSAKNNPALEEKDITTASFHKARSGRDYIWWEYSYLYDMQALRFLNGIKPQAQLLSGKDDTLSLKVAKAFSGSAVVVYRNMYRDVKATVTIPLKLNAGTHSVKIPARQLPGGTFIAEVQILNAAKKVVDAGAFRIDRKAAVPVEVKFADAERIFPKGKEIKFTVNVKNAPKDAMLEVEIEDVFKRIIYRNISKAKDANSFTVMGLPRTHLNNLFVRVKANGKLLAETMEEFASPQGKPDFTEYYGLTWGSANELKYKMGIVAATLGGIDWVNTPVYIRGLRQINVDPSPMGMYKYSTTGRLYRSDRKSDPVRTPCFSDPAFHKANSERLAKWAKISKYRYYDVQNFWSGDEQYLGASVCYSPHCLKLFRENLKKQYKDIAALNKEWNSSFKSFDAVIPQQQDELKDKNNLAPWLDHKLFMAQVYAKGQFGFFAKELEKHSSYIKFGPSGTANPGLGYDWYQMMKYCKLLSYYDGIQVKLIHDFGGKEIRAGKWGAYGHAHIDSEPYVYNPMWEGLLRGSNMAAVWPPTMTNGDGTALRNFYHVERSLKELNSGIGKMWLSADRRPEIAVLYSQSSLYTAMNFLGNSQWQNSQSSWVKLLEDLKYDCKFISYEELAEKGVAKNYKVLVLPCSLSISEKESAAIAAFVKRGGVVIADVAPGRFDGHGKRWDNPVLAPIFPANKGALNSTLQEAPALKGKFFTAEADLPVNTVKKYGKGKGVLLNLLIGQYHFIQLGGTGGELSKAVSGDAKFQLTLRTLVDSILREAKVHREISVVNAKGAEFPCMGAMRYDNGNKILFLHQSHFGKEGERFIFKNAVPVTVKLLAKGHVYDVREGKYLGYTDSFKSSILPAWSRIYSIQQKKVSALKVTAPAAAARGDVFKVKFEAAGAAGAQVFHVEFLDPAGKADAVSTRNYHSVTPQSGCHLQIPYNGAKGIWQVCVTHVNTGLKKNVKIKVK